MGKTWVTIGFVGGSESGYIRVRLRVFSKSGVKAVCGGGKLSGMTHLYHTDSNISLP